MVEERQLLILLCGERTWQTLYVCICPVTNPNLRRVTNEVRCKFCCKCSHVCVKQRREPHYLKEVQLTDI